MEKRLSSFDVGYIFCLGCARSGSALSFGGAAKLVLSGQSSVDASHSWCSSRLVLVLKTSRIEDLMVL